MGVVVGHRHPSLIKPSLWQLNPTRVDPDWRWLWRERVVAILPLWEKGGDPMALPVKDVGTLEAGATWADSDRGAVVNFDGTSTGRIRFGSGLYQFLTADKWSTWIVFRVADTAADDRGLWSKFASGSDLQFYVRIDRGTAPQNIEVFAASTSPGRIFGGNVIQLNTWYLVGLTNDGSSSTTSLTLYTILLDGAILDDGLTGQHPSNATNAGDVTIGATDADSDEMFGDVLTAGIIDGHVITRDQFVQIALEPTGMFRMAQRRIAAVAPAVSGRIMSSLAHHGGLVGAGGIAGQGGGLAG